jgi:hypothetical protein
VYCSGELEVGENAVVVRLNDVVVVGVLKEGNGVLSSGVDEGGTSEVESAALVDEGGALEETGVSLLDDGTGVSLVEEGTGVLLELGGGGELVSSGVEDGGGGGGSSLVVVGTVSACATCVLVVTWSICGTVVTYVTLGSVAVSRSLVDPTIGSHAPSPIGLPSWARTVGRVLR